MDHGEEICWVCIPKVEAPFYWRKDSYINMEWKKWHKNDVIHTVEGRRIWDQLDRE